MAKTQVFYRIIRAGRGHPFAGMYAVEQVGVKDGVVVLSEIVHEWDLRSISSAKLAELGGDSAYKEYILDHPGEHLESAHTINNYISSGKIAQTESQQKQAARKDLDIMLKRDKNG